MTRWKQRDIHEKREVRKHKIAHLEAQIACNNVLLPKIKDISSALSNPSTSTPPTAYFTNLVEQLEKNPSRDCPPGNDPTKIEQTYDGMLLSLLQRVTQDSKDKIKSLNLTGSEKGDRLGKELAEQMEFHVKNLGETIAKDQKELEIEVEEQKRKITSEDIHEGFDTKVSTLFRRSVFLDLTDAITLQYVPPKAEPPPVPTTKVGSSSKGKGKQKVTEIEVLNPAGVAKAAPLPAGDPEPELESDDEGLPTMTPSLIEFSKIPLGAYEESFKFIQSHRDVYVPGATDALLVAAFEAEGEGKRKYAKKCVHQSLLLQYCEKLGTNGVGMFFKK